MLSRNEKLAEYVAISSLLVLASASVVDASSPCIPTAAVATSVSVPITLQRVHNVTVASLNLAGQAHIDSELVAWTHQRAIDILLLQEVGHPSSDGAAFVAALSEQLERFL